MNKRPGHVVVTTDVAVCTFCGRPRTLRREAHQLGALVRTIVTCETCHRTLSSTIAVGTAEPAAEPAAETVSEPSAESVSEPAPEPAAVTAPAAKKPTPKRAATPAAKTAAKAATSRTSKATSSRSRTPKAK